MRSQARSAGVSPAVQALAERLVSDAELSGSTRPARSGSRRRSRVARDAPSGEETRARDEPVRLGEVLAGAVELMRA